MFLDIGEYYINMANVAYVHFLDSKGTAHDLEIVFIGGGSLRLSGADAMREYVSMLATFRIPAGVGEASSI